MDLHERKVKFEVDRIQLFLEKLEEAEIEWFWQALNDIRTAFPKIDIYHAGSGKYGYLGFGIKPILTGRVKDFLLVSHLGNNESGEFLFKLEVIQALADFIAENNSTFSFSFTYKDLANHKFTDWLYELKKYAFKFGMNLEGQGLLPADYKNQSLTAIQTVDYLKERYPNTYSGTVHIAAFKTPLGRELALDPKSKTPVIICDTQPPEEIKLTVKKEYSETDTRHHHLSTHAKTLQVGKKIFSVIISNLDELEKFCDWYGQSNDQTTALELKINAFLELWPAERLKNLTVEEYHQAKNKDCFIAQIDSFDPTQGDPTFACYFDIWEPVSLGDNDKYHNQRPYSWDKRLGDNAEIAFETLKQEILNIVEAVQRRDLYSIDQILFPKRLKWMIAFLYQDFNNPLIIPIVTEVNTKRIGYDHLYPKLPLPEFLLHLLADKGEQAFFPYVEKLFAMVRKGYLDNKQKKQQTKELMDEVMNQQPLNRILFGAAGTGKTYSTINHALAILEEEDLTVIENQEEQPNGRKTLKDRFDKFKNEGRIKFVTFHQSFSYEDFVEGIRAETDDTGKLTYDVQAGVFKEICKRAVFKQVSEIDIDKTIDEFVKEISQNEKVLETKTGVEFTVFNSSGKGGISVRTTTQNEIVLSKKAIKNYLLDPSENIRSNQAYAWAVARYIKSKLDEKISDNTDAKLKSFVLIIDEINRGNISRIFGELITLIEDSKRQGAEEELSVTLPYSKEEFSVPSNVYIIGTMNSSDRSLTGLDIALRRRFTFIEMPPKPELLNEIEVEGLNIGELLKVINQRIEVLLDRDHCIGHANFMSLKKDCTREHLAAIFKQKIIPQLQEYFFDDWAKINMVLNANGMLNAKPIERSALFPNVDTDSDGFFEEQKTWQLVDTAFDSIASFSKIIKH
ncbi:AAA family ATPase [Acinetobacter radioresistens]|nr:AAA family ATPase [Acinetobacter radioresistens]